jgi:hypothetical protein
MVAMDSTKENSGTQEKKNPLATAAMTNPKTTSGASSYYKHFALILLAS